jgi:hypothetical protein
MSIGLATIKKEVDEMVAEIVVKLCVGTKELAHRLYKYREERDENIQDL